MWGVAAGPLCGVVGFGTDVWVRHCDGAVVVVGGRDRAGAPRSRPGRILTVPIVPVTPPHARISQVGNFLLPAKNLIPETLPPFLSSFLLLSATCL